MKSKIASSNGNNTEEMAHTSFLLKKLTGLKMDNNFHNYATWHYLSHIVRRQPTDLINHTRRIYICTNFTLRQYLPGALHDLFLVLGTNGFPLRSHIFESSKPFLDNPDISNFHRWLTKQKNPRGFADNPKGSILSIDILGINKSNIRLVRNKRTLSTGYITILQEVEDRIAQGQIGIAKTLLEDSLSDNPIDLKLKNKLIEIYRHEQNWEAVDALSN